MQDQFTFNRLTFNVGLRAEQWKHFATTGEDIFTFDWAVAPRLSAAYDVRGDGRQKIYGYYGRYYDPIRNNMTNFAGTLSGSVREEQVFINDEWVTYRTRGGLVQQDAFFAPTTKTPYTDDVTAGYQVDLGRQHEPRGGVHQPPDPRHPRGLRPGALRLLDERHDRLSRPDRRSAVAVARPRLLRLRRRIPASNFVIATLNGGKRNYQGVDLIFRKRYSNNWQLLGSYTYNWAKGNTNSDSNADFQGDVLYLDPLAPNTYQQQPGIIPHVFKAAGSYIWPVGIELGARLPLQLAAPIASRTALASQRNLPIQVDVPYDVRRRHRLLGGVRRDRLAAEPGAGRSSTCGRSTRSGSRDVGTEFFVDIFNVLNNQDSIRDQDLVAGAGRTAFGEPIRFLDPRRFFLGARLTF